MSFFNILLPFNLLLKDFSHYSKTVLDYSERLNNQLQSNECFEIKLNVNFYLIFVKILLKICLLKILICEFTNINLLAKR